MIEQSLLETLETPCVVVDLALAEANIRRMQAAADAAACKLRPHIKTHKSRFFARKQVEAGAAGITCAKVSEAEVMADAGIEDIFLAYPQIGPARLRRVTGLNGRIRRLIVGIDSAKGAELLDEAAGRTTKPVEVRLEVDCGAKRSGVPYEAALSLAKYIQTKPNLNLTGIYTFKSMIYRKQVTVDAVLAAQEEGELMRRLADELLAADIPIRDVSAGSTPTGLPLARSGLVNEIRPGTYIFNDHMCVCEQAAKPEEIAVRIYATVVSCPEPGLAVIDGGTKTFPTDIRLGEAPYYYPSYALVEGREDLRLLRLNEEHGILTSDSGNCRLKVGDVLALVPIHVCTAVNLQNYVYLLDGNRLRKEKVDARGCLL